jgi:hypothetical protein
LFDDGDSTHALQINEHEGAAGQTSLFASDLDLGRDDSEIRSVDAARHAAQVADAMEVLSARHGPFTRDEQLAMQRAVEHTGRWAARLDIMRELLSALLRSRGEGDR